MLKMSTVGHGRGESNTRYLPAHEDTQQFCTYGRRAGVVRAYGVGFEFNYTSNRRRCAYGSSQKIFFRGFQTRVGSTEKGESSEALPEQKAKRQGSLKGHVECHVGCCISLPQGTNAARGGPCRGSTVAEQKSNFRLILAQFVSRSIPSLSCSIARPLVRCRHERNKS